MKEPGAVWVSLMYEPSQTTTTRTGLQTRFKHRCKLVQTENTCKLGQNCVTKFRPPTFAGRWAVQCPISRKQVSHVAEKGLFSTHSPLETHTVETDLSHTWEVGRSFLLDARSHLVIEKNNEKEGFVQNSFCLGTRFLAHMEGGKEQI